MLDNPWVPEAIALHPTLRYLKLVAWAGCDDLLPRGGGRGFPHWGTWMERNRRFTEDMLQYLVYGAWAQHCCGVWEPCCETCSFSVFPLLFASLFLSPLFSLLVPFFLPSLFPFPYCAHHHGIIVGMTCKPHANVPTARVLLYAAMCDNSQRIRCHRQGRHGQHSGHTRHRQCRLVCLSMGWNPARGAGMRTPPSLRHEQRCLPRPNKPCRCHGGARWKHRCVVATRVVVVMTCRCTIILFR